MVPKAICIPWSAGECHGGGVGNWFKRTSVYKITSRISVDPHCTREMIISRMRVVYAPSTNGYRLLTGKSATSGAAGLGNASGRLNYLVAGTMVVLCDNELLRLHAMCRSDCGC